MWSDRLSDPGTVAEVVFGLALIALLVSGLIVRKRGGRGDLFKYSAIWIAFAAILLIGYSMKDEAIRLGRTLLAELVPAMGLEEGQAISFRASTNGHFMVEAKVDGQSVRFLVDSGASDVTLTMRDAERLGFDRKALTFDQVYQTANGIVKGAPVRLKRVEIGPVALDDVRASVTEAPLATSLLGMSFLSRLTSWQVEGDRLTLSR